MGPVAVIAEAIGEVLTGWLNFVVVRLASRGPKFTVDAAAERASQYREGNAVQVPGLARPVDGRTRPCRFVVRVDPLSRSRRFPGWDEKYLGPIDQFFANPTGRRDDLVTFSRLVKNRQWEFAFIPEDLHTLRDAQDRA